ncbi:hypothetical protein GCK72_015971 [Caenorhabditis remanei]|uniref:Uncharacterized protein n=1 Tax=Caenorhabditis remanei TaxID=31234 RepID=A0A6A5GY40_CAERE|nr:hypothetical protein GCK72_015971 [Caenorhabditis remanei]KAF1759504.1 hypothetical protein GCK72_015971 [Caenorhabditis remanei]
MSSLVQLPAHVPSTFQLNFDEVRNIPNAPEVDCEGGVLTKTEEYEEIDPSDGCTVRIFTYYIDLPNQEQLTKTVRQKLQFACTQKMTRTSLVGSEAQVVENCQRISGDIRGMRPIEFTNNSRQICLDQHNLQLDLSNEQDQQIDRVLNQVPDTFMNVLSKEKDMFIKMYPDLFKAMRSESSLIPSTVTEVIQNEDGSTTTRTRKSKSYSSHFSRQSTYVNGVKTMSKSKFRAFVEYQGPEGGFQVKLSDGEDLPSEDELEEDDTKSQSCISEIDSDSDITVPSSHKTDLEKRYQKAWYAAKELVDSEERYVEKLKLLGDTFRNRLIKEEVLTNDKITRLLANVSSLYQFHNTHFLPQLMNSIREWRVTKRIADVVRKQAPYLKMYSEYTNNYDRASKLFEELKKKKKFADLVKEIEKQPECEGLPLVHHLICPVQRVMRYQLLLQEYIKHLRPDDADYRDSEEALKLVLAAAAHANEMMKKLDRFGKVIEVQEQLGNSISLVSPGRELLKSGAIQKISSTTEKTEDRFIFLFNDLVILASERKMIGMAKYKLRAVFSASHMQVCEGDNLEREHSFYLRGSDGTGPKRCVELFTPTQKEKNEWVEAISANIDEAKANSSMFTTSSRSSISENDNNNSIESKHCADCDSEFGFLTRGAKCVKCHRRLCKKCFGRHRNESKKSRICDTCTKNMDLDGIPRSFSTQSTTNSRTNRLQVPARGPGVLHSSQIKFRGSLGKPTDRFCVVRDDFCMYTYLSEEDKTALAMLPLPGCEVKICGEKFTFSVRVGARRMYTMTAQDEENQMKWMAILDLAANAHLKNQRNSGSEQSESG